MSLDAAREAAAMSGAPFRSVLFPTEAEAPPLEAPAFFHDLHLDDIVQAVTASRQEYDLAPLFYVHLTSLEEIAYRQAVMRDMEEPPVREAVSAFADRMRTMRERLALARTSYYRAEKRRWHLAAAEAYAEAVERLAADLAALPLASRGLQGFRAALADYAGASAFRALADEARAIAAALAAIRYCLLIREGSVTVRRFEGETDYSATVEETFRKFQQGAVKDYRHKFKDLPGMNHVEAEIAERVALLFPEELGALAHFCERHPDFIDPLLARFDREIQFYVAYLAYADRFRRAGLAFCYPEMSSERKDVVARATFDLALAGSLQRERAATVVCNDVVLHEPERVLVVTGPNQGGKTTFARAFGQVHYLASLGCPVPGREARLFLYDRLFTHFEREEDVATLRGKLEDDLVRMRAILDQATPRSLVIINEIFSSTTLEDAVLLGGEVLGRLLRLDLLCVCVTFLDELTALGPKTVSLVAGVDPADPAVRTFRIERRPADGLAFALAVAERHRVTYRWLQERLPR
jgi:hypothetical protein